MSVDYRVGDVRDVMASIPDGSVSLVATSPPFLALRSYLPAGHDAKHAEIGSEPDPATFLDTLLALTAEWGRVLAPWGSIAIELGDTYSGTNPKAALDASEWRGDGGTDGGLGKGRGNKKTGGRNWPANKCLALIPQLYATSLAYGRNILTGAESPAGQWLIRNVIVWHRPNPAVSALGDKFRPSTSYITVATRSPKRWFDLTAVRTEPSRPRPGTTAHKVRDDADPHALRGSLTGVMELNNPAGAPPLDTWLDHHDTWTLTTQPSSLAHYAMWPAKLAERLVLSMCPLEVCAVCGEPRRRMEKATDEYRAMRSNVGDFKVTRDRSGGLNGTTQQTTTLDHERQAITLGWSDCGCSAHVGFDWTRPAFIPGLVLDPFAGTGTTLAVADLHGRDAIGIDIDARNRDLYPRRYDEVKKALYGTQPEMPGQLEMML
jgi:DNA modification methylase